MRLNRFTRYILIFWLMLPLAVIGDVQLYNWIYRGTVPITDLYPSSIMRCVIEVGCITMGMYFGKKTTLEDISTKKKT
jgi:hypothetical protein